MVECRISLLHTCIAPILSYQNNYNYSSVTDHIHTFFPLIISSNEMISKIDDNVINNVKNENIKPLLFALKILYNSIEFFPRNKRISFSIFTLLTLPLSFFLFSFSLSARPIKLHILHLEALGRFAQTRFEAIHVLKESRAEAFSLLRLRLLYFLPSYPLSLISAITTVVYVHSSSSSVPISFRHHVISTWKRPFLTSLCIYAVMILYSNVVSFVSVFANIFGARMPVLVAGFVVEIYVMAVAGVGLVVSVIEDKAGFDAIRAGSDVMEGKRLCGWIITSWFVMVTGVTGWRWDRAVVMITDGGDYDLGKERWVATVSWEKVVLIVLYGVALLWSFVVTTLFYCECRKQHDDEVHVRNDAAVVPAD